MKAYRVVPMLTETGGYFSIAVVEDDAPERRLDVRFSTRAEAEAAVERLARREARKPSIDADQVRQMDADGLGVTAIAKQLGISRTGVRLLDASVEAARDHDAKERRAGGES
jgi:hypothetical protein